MKPFNWQTEPHRVLTERVQYWKNGIMITAQCSNEKARELVAAGQAFVICDQAIGALVDGHRA